MNYNYFTTKYKYNYTLFSNNKSPTCHDRHDAALCQNGSRWAQRISSSRFTSARQRSSLCAKLLNYDAELLIVLNARPP